MLYFVCFIDIEWNILINILNNIYITDSNNTDIKFINTFKVRSGNVFLDLEYSIYSEQIIEKLKIALSNIKK